MNWQGPRSMIGLLYLILGFILGGSFFRHGEQRLDDLWYIYMSPTFDEENQTVLALVALACFGLGVTCFLSSFLRSLSEYLSSIRMGRFIAGLSVSLAFIAMGHFSQPLITAFLLGIPLCVWSWLRSDPDDNWF